MASTTARRITARRICNRGVGFSDWILMDGAAAAARAVPAPACASKFASRTTRVTLRGARGRSLRVTVYNCRPEALSRGFAACTEKLLGPSWGRGFSLTPEGQQTRAVAWPEAPSGLVFLTLGDTWVQVRVPRPHWIGKRFWSRGVGRTLF